ncbi:MAG: hypothetical protein EXR98_12165 [Gemmataceae bacterium]|nr:hypothetical protein [Gemmataceae bacterium]
MRNVLALVFGTLIASMMIAAPFSYKYWRDREPRNFRVVEDGILYRCGQLRLPRMEQIVALYGIRTVVSLRDGSQAVDEQEERWVNAKGLKFVRIPYRQWTPDETGKVPGDESVRTFRDVMDDPANYPVLVHCFAGIHRTGTMCATFRIDFQGWSNAQAMAEMRAMGYTILDNHEDVRNYITNYSSPRAAKSVPAAPAVLKK